MNKQFLRNSLQRIEGARVLVLGDIIIDHFIWGRVRRISPEAPVPVVEVGRENLLLGGAANVLHNIHSLGGRGYLCGVAGADPMADRLSDLLNDLGVSRDGVIRDSSRPTMVKTRIIAHNQQVVRFDREKTDPIDGAVQQAICEYLDRMVPDVDAIVISDYAKGLITAPLMAHLHSLIEATGKKPIIVDPKPGRLPLFAGATVITPNNLEAEQMSGIAIVDEESLGRAAESLLDILRCQAVLITRGEAGMALLERDRPMFKIPTKAREVYDVTGAGDTVVAMLSLGLAAGLDFQAAASLANYAAGIVVGKLGTATVTREEIMEVLR